MKGDNPIILFDGYCNLCDHSVQFVIRNDPQKQFKFAALQSEIGQQLLKKGGLLDLGNNTFILIESEQYYTRSTAALRVLRLLGGYWSYLYSLRIIPPFLRDAVYRFVARYRYRFWGKKDECMMPTKELQDRFL
jgi:predicted DCC family thiol-disulfide oxidoreductase YuxK